MLVHCRELQFVEPLGEMSVPLLDDFRRGPVVCELGERPRHSVDFGGRQRGGKVLAALQNWKCEASPYASQEFGSLGHADALCFVLRKPNDLSGDFRKPHRFTVGSR